MVDLAIITIRAVEVPQKTQRDQTDLRINVQMIRVASQKSNQNSLSVVVQINRFQFTRLIIAALVLVQ
jgi:hypothetical protein